MSIFLPEFADADFNSTKLCWYTDSLDNSFVVCSSQNHRVLFRYGSFDTDTRPLQIDHVPTYADGSVFVATGGSGHGAKFLPVLGEAG